MVREQRAAVMTQGAERVKIDSSYSNGFVVRELYQLKVNDRAKDETAQRDDLNKDHRVNSIYIS